MARDIMIDLETMGTGPTAAIVQIGAVLFDTHSSYIADHNFHADVGLQSSLLLGMTIATDTVDWWRDDKQEAARLSLIKGNFISLPVALKHLSIWIMASGKDAHVWSHGAAFDLPILQHAYELVGQEQPWHYRKAMDTRTLFRTAKGLGWEQPEVTQALAHDAVNDCYAQVGKVQSAFMFLDRLVPAVRMAT